MNVMFRVLRNAALPSAVFWQQLKPRGASFTSRWLTATYSCPPTDGGQGGNGGTGGHGGGTGGYGAHDGGTDSGSGGTDSGSEGGFDSGTDGGLDAGYDAGPPPSCVPARTTATRSRHLPGAFVSNATGSDAGPGQGTQASPYASISAALAAHATTIYVCAGATAYTEAISLSTKVTIYGGLDCSTWAYNASTPTQLTAAAVPVTLTSGATGSAINDFEVKAAHATTAGGSAIAIIDNGAAITLTNVSVTAGAGARGTSGQGGSSIAILTNGGALTLDNVSLTAGAGGKGADGATQAQVAQAAPGTTALDIQLMRAPPTTDSAAQISMRLREHQLHQRRPRGPFGQ